MEGISLINSVQIEQYIVQVWLAIVIVLIILDCVAVGKWRKFLHRISFFVWEKNLKKEQCDRYYWLESEHVYTSFLTPLQLIKTISVKNGFRK